MQMRYGQNPIVAVLACSDSRVPVELIFDQGLGDAFVIRTAGEIIDLAVLGSLEYAVESLHVVSARGGHGFIVHLRYGACDLFWLH